MGILDDLKHKAEELGDKAREGLDAARDKAGDLVDEVRERLGQHDSEQAPLGESEDVAPDTSSTAAVQPDYVTGEDADEGFLAEDDAGGEALGVGTLPEGDLDVEESALSENSGDVLDTDALAGDEPDAGEAPGDQSGALDPIATTETDAPDPVDPEGSSEPADAVGSADATGPADALDLPESGASEADTREPAAEPAEPLVETDVDPYAEPLTQTIGDEIALDPVDREALSEAVEDASSERDS